VYEKVTASAVAFKTRTKVTGYVGLAGGSA